jgi:cytochrome P450
MSVVEQTEAPPQGFSYDPYSIEAMSNPTQYWDTLREHFPIYYIEKYDLFVLSRFEHVWELLTLGDNALVTTEGQQPMQETLLSHNDGPVPDVSHDPMVLINFQRSPVYDQMRQSFSKPLRPGSVQRLEAFIREQAAARLDLLLPRRKFDLTRDYAGIVSATTICHMFRLPLTEAKYILDQVNEASRTDPDRPSTDMTLIMKMMENTCNVIEPLVRARRAEGPDGSWPLVDGMLSVEIDGRKLTDREISETLGSEVMIGGSETVPKIVAHGLWELKKRPEQLAEVREDLGPNARLAWDEMVRLCSPGQRFSRTVNKPIVLGGQEMKPGQRVSYIPSAAARDPREYGPDAAEFKWNREIKRMVNFGMGQHFCMGIHLANLEGSVLVEEFLRKVRDFEVDEENAVRYPSTFQWGWNELPITVEPSEE